MFAGYPLLVGQPVPPGISRRQMNRMEPHGTMNELQFPVPHAAACAHHMDNTGLGGWAMKGHPMCLESPSDQRYVGSGV